MTAVFRVQYTLGVSLLSFVHFALRIMFCYIIQKKMVENELNGVTSGQKQCASTVFE